MFNEKGCLSYMTNFLDLIGLHNMKTVAIQMCTELK